MAGKPIVELLRETFPASLQADWKRAASQEIEGQNPDSRLSWKNADELTFMPYYDESNVATLNSYKNFQLKPGTGPYSSPRQWYNLSPIQVTNAVTANGLALDHLQHGADGIYFDLLVESSCDFNKLLSTVEWPYCALTLRINTPSTFEQLSTYISSMKFAQNALNGALFWNEIPDTKNLLQETTILTQKNLYILGAHISASSPVAEICDALVNGVKFFSTVEHEKKLLASVYDRIAFSLTAENNFLLTIAKLKALRLLWFQVIRAYGFQDFNPDKLHLHVRCQPWVEEKFQPHGNMLFGTISALGSIAGGCDSLTVFPEDESNVTMSRIARNVSVVLKEESHLDKVADPLAGAYSLEVITHEMASKAWSLFQSAVQKI